MDGISGPWLVLKENSYCACHVPNMSVYVYKLSSMSLLLHWMRSVMTWCYVTTLEVCQAYGQILFRGQCCWKNFSVWRKQTSHCLCSLLSGCINKPLSSHSVPHFPLSEAHHAHCCTPTSNKLVICLQETHSSSVVRIVIRCPLLFCFTDPWKETCSMLCDLVSRDQWGCHFEFSSENSTGNGNPI